MRSGFWFCLGLLQVLVHNSSSFGLDSAYYGIDFISKNASTPSFVIDESNYNTIYLIIGNSQDVTIEARCLCCQLDQTIYRPAPDDPISLIYKFSVNGGKSSNQTDLLDIKPSNITFQAGVNTSTLSILSKRAGHVLLTLAASDGNDSCCKFDQAYLHVQVYHSASLHIVNQVIGWVYFAAWTISFIPQIYLNWSRKSVKGLNFDFLALNLTGFAFYALFNCFLLWDPEIGSEFNKKNPYDIVPVEINDGIFAIYAAFLTLITVFQCFIYERAGQSMSIYGKLLTCACLLFAAICLIISLANPTLLPWLQFLYFLSYVKLGITAVKYIPQAYMNYSRKSTIGWSIGNILLDFTGGSFSILQMFLIAYNYDDWASIFLNPTKFGLGALSIIFDVIFIVQHYCLYRNRKEGYEPVNNHEQSDLINDSGGKGDGYGGT